MMFDDQKFYLYLCYYNSIFIHYAITTAYKSIMLFKTHNSEI